MTCDPLELIIQPPYIGSAVSPTVEITETETAYTVTITDFRGAHSYTIQKTDGAIAEAEQAAAIANAAAQYARDTADQAAQDAQETADEAAGRADTAAASANQAAQSANSAAGTANTAASNADAKAALADSKAALANTAATTANQAAQAAEAAKTAANTAAGQATTAAGNATTAAGQANTAAGNATTAAGQANTAATNADAKAALANTAAQNADSKATLADNAAQSATTAAATANTAAATATQAAETITDGYFPNMIAGAAEALMDAPTLQDAFAERVSTHDGVARIESIHGNTMVFNQLASLTNLNPSTTNNGVTLTKNADGSVTASGTASGSASPVINYLTVERGHKYLLRGLPGGSASTYYFGVSGVKVDLGNGGIWTSTVDASNYTLRMDFTTGVTVDFTFYPQCFDLTAMFGSGNEPATVAEFEALFPASYYAYDAGNLLSVNIEGVNDREIPADTYFPTGIKSAGSAYDELQADKAITRIGVVDLGTLNWTYNSNGFFVASHAGIKRNENVDVPSNEINSNGYVSVGNIGTASDKSIAVNVARHGFNTILIKDSAYTDATAFKAAMSGVMLYYELATPTETAINPPLTLTYTVKQGGTELIVIPTGENSAPAPMAIAYAQDPDGVRDKALAVIAPIEGVTASTNYAVNAYLIHGGQLCRVTSAIATGETITPGSNCVACTVMGEIVRLTA